MIGTNRYIGSPVERIEDPRFLRGRGQFVGDLKREMRILFDHENSDALPADVADLRQHAVNE